ncbi:hypothetical protein LZ30DRAFT_698182 [Colletotrichum cereale]|nr:hypothetical protein LZ30DRAFT_698182 [Colletotrichum cereale]
MQHAGRCKAESSKAKVGLAAAAGRRAFWSRTAWPRPEAPGLRITSWKVLGRDPWDGHSRAAGASRMLGTSSGQRRLSAFPPSLGRFPAACIPRCAPVGFLIGWVCYPRSMSSVRQNLDYPLPRGKGSQSSPWAGVDYTHTWTEMPAGKRAGTSIRTLEDQGWRKGNRRVAIGHGQFPAFVRRSWWHTPYTRWRYWYLVGGKT